jgi:crotonobetainyl-CoA:carnitine CoA-transferase CaiB-like acyl-CoA transferase
VIAGTSSVGPLETFWFAPKMSAQRAEAEVCRRDGGVRRGPVAAQDRHRGRGRPSARGEYLFIENPIKLSDSPADVTRSPLLGEHTDEVLRQVLGFSDHQVAEIHASVSLLR